MHCPNPPPPSSPQRYFRKMSSELPLHNAAPNTATLQTSDDECPFNPAWIFFFFPLVLWLIIYLCTYDYIGCYPVALAFFATIPSAFIGPYVAVQWNSSRQLRMAGQLEGERNLVAVFLGMGCAFLVGWVITISLWKGALEAQCPSHLVAGVSGAVSAVSRGNGTWGQWK